MTEYPPTIPTVLVAGHVPKPTVEALEATGLGRSWRNQTIKVLCEVLLIARTDPDPEPLGVIMERALLAMAHNQATYDRIYQYLHNEGAEKQ
jgi:hypothetical protein